MWLAILVLILSLGMENFTLARRTRAADQTTAAYQLPNLPSYDEATKCKEDSPTCVHGKCVENRLFEEYRNGTLVCSCFDGWIGKDCDQRTLSPDGSNDLPPSFEDAVMSDELCEPNPCQANGRCKKNKFDPRGYICICKDYRTGLHCESDCEYPYFGKKCDQKCIGCTGKICRSKKGCAKCNVPGYVGEPHCNVTDCLELPCENLGRCTTIDHELYGKFGACVCPTGYVGPRCETYSPESDWQRNATPCFWGVHNPCKSGSTCVYHPGTISPVCICAKGFLGDNCQWKCRPNKECKNGDCSIMSKVEFREMAGAQDYLKKLDGNFRLACICQPGYGGKHCHKKCKRTWGKFCVNKCGHCKRPPCDVSNGLCPDNKCAKNYYGVRCEKKTTKSGQVEQNMGLRITVINADDMRYEVNKSSPEAQNLVDELRIFISKSYEKNGKNVVGVNNILIEEASSEILAIARKAYGASGRKKDKPVRKSRLAIGPFGTRSFPAKTTTAANASISDIKHFKTLIKRAPDAPDAQEYDVNFTVVFEGESDVGGQAASILRKEANNFAYPGVSIVKNSIKAGEKRVVKGTSGLESSNTNDGTLGLEGIVSLILILTISVAVLVWAGWVISGRRSSTIKNKLPKRKQAAKNERKSAGKLTGKGRYKRSESSTRKSKVKTHGKRWSSASSGATMA